MSNSTKSIRLIAIFEASKGVLVLLAGFGVFGLIHHNAQARAEELVRHFHLNPARSFPRVFIDAAAKVHDSSLRLLAVGALFYAGLRLLEAFGLWHDRRWAQWMGAVSGGIYIPIEIFELFRGVTWPKLVVLSVNAVCVAYLVGALRSRRSRAELRTAT